MGVINRQIVLRRRPHGLVGPGDTELVSAPAPVPADGETMGEVMFKGNIVMKGYLKNAKTTAA